MSYDAALADQVRALLAGTPGLFERKMFGGLAFLVNGNFAVSAYKSGGLLIRCAREDWNALCAEDGAQPMMRKGAPLSGWVEVDPDVVEREESLSLWVRRGLAYASAQPPKRP